MSYCTLKTSLALPDERQCDIYGQNKNSYDEE